MDFSQFSKKLKKQLEKALYEATKAQNMKDIANQTKKEIVERTRAGKGVKKPGGNQSKLKPLKPSTIKARSYDKKLSSYTSPAKSNLTRSGKMLESLDTKVKNNEFEIVVKGDRKKVAEYVSVERPFLNIGKKQLTKLKRHIKDQIKKILSRI